VALADAQLRVAQVGGGGQGELQPELADFQPIVIDQGRALPDPLAVEKGAVAAAEVFQKVGAVGGADLGVTAAHHLRGQANVHVRIAANHRSLPGQRERPAGFRSFQNDELRHAACCNPWRAGLQGSGATKPPTVFASRLPALFQGYPCNMESTEAMYTNVCKCVMYNMTPW
jgi:hypothetical protein